MLVISLAPRAYIDGQRSPQRVEHAGEHGVFRGPETQVRDDQGVAGERAQDGAHRGARALGAQDALKKRI